MVPAPTIMSIIMQPLSVPAPRCTADSDDYLPSPSEDEDAQQPPFVLTPELIAGVVKQVEFYFSDANLPTDKKLLKQIRKDPDGFVPVKLFANFRKVRALTKDVAVITEALQVSTTLQLSDDAKKVRRLNAVPDYDIVDIQKRTIIVEHLPPTPTIESVTEMFSIYGKVTLVRICSKESKGKLPSWLTAATHSMAQQQHAFVEFAEADAAIMAVAALHDDDGWGSSVRVRHLLHAPSDKDGNVAPAPQRAGGASRRATRDASPPQCSTQSSFAGVSTTIIRNSAGGTSSTRTSHPGSDHGVSAPYHYQQPAPFGDVRRNTDGICTFAAGKVMALAGRQSGEISGAPFANIYRPPGRRSMDEQPAGMRLSAKAFSDGGMLSASQLTRAASGPAGPRLPAASRNCHSQPGDVPTAALASHRPPVPAKSPGSPGAGPAAVLPRHLLGDSCPSSTPVCGLQTAGSAPSSVDYGQLLGSRMAHTSSGELFGNQMIDDVEGFIDNLVLGPSVQACSSGTWGMSGGTGSGDLSSSSSTCSSTGGGAGTGGISVVGPALVATACAAATAALTGRLHAEERPEALAAVAEEDAPQLAPRAPLTLRNATRPPVAPSADRRRSWHAMPDVISARSRPAGPVATSTAPLSRRFCSEGGAFPEPLSNPYDDTRTQTADADGDIAAAEKRRRPRRRRSHSSPYSESPAAAAHVSTGGAELYLPRTGIPHSPQISDGGAAHAHIAVLPSSAESKSTALADGKAATIKRVVAAASKKDYASWAAATPEFRAESLAVRPANGARASGEVCVTASSPPQQHPSDHHVHIARGPDGSRGFVGRRTSSGAF